MSRITDAMLAEYSEDNHEPDNRPVLITPGIYMGHLVDWNKSFNPMFRKYLLVMNFRIVLVHTMVLQKKMNVVFVVVQV